MSKPTPPRIYVSLFIAWDDELDDAIRHLKPYEFKFDEYVDNDLLPRRVLLEKFKKKGLRTKAFRHNWCITSNGRVKNSSLDLHLAWLFKRWKPRTKLSALVAKGFRVRLACFFETAQFGAGPVVTAKAAGLLAYHQVNLEFDIYPIQDADD